jgi:DNA-binding transcriptional ArsR family regulator
MLRLWLGPGDLARVRFSDRLHPVGTAMLACQALREPAVAAAAPDLARRAGAETPLLRTLHHLLPPRGLLPDFLTPRDGVDSMEAGLAAIRSTAPRRVRAEVSAAYAHLPPSVLRRRFAAGDPDVLETLLTAIHGYFSDVLAPDWAALLEAHRARISMAAQRYVLAGVDGVLSGLHPRLRWRPPVLEIDTWRTPNPPRDRDVRLTGEGVILVPSPFAGQRPRVLTEPGRPALVVYPVGSTAAAASPPVTGDPLQRLIGRTRGAVLRRVAEPGRHTTSAVARDVGISVSSSSEHLTALRVTGMIASHRDGGAVIHHATPLGTRLLAQAGPRP